MTNNALLSDSDTKTLFEYLYPPALSGDNPGSDGDIELPFRDGLDPDIVTLNNEKMYNRCSDRGEIFVER